MPEIALLARRSIPGRIDNLVLDAVLTDSHNYSNTVTDFPVESGANISDHIRKDPVSVTVVGFITNTPIEVDDAVTERTINEISDVQARGLAELSSNRVQAAFVELMQIIGEDFPAQPSSSNRVVGKPRVIEIVTGLRVYSDMVVTKLDITRRPEDGQSMTFTAIFKHIRKVSLSQVLIPNAKSVGVGDGNAPRITDQAKSKLKKNEANPEELKSVFIRFIDWAAPNLEKTKDKLDDFFSTPALWE